jgi:hypothetical protein
MDEKKINNRVNRRSLLWRSARVALLVVSALIFLCAGLVVFLRVGVSGDQVARLLIPRLEKALDKKIAASSVHLAWLSWDSAKLSVTQLTVREAAGSQVFLSIPASEMEIGLGEVLSGTLLIYRLTLTQPALSLSPRPMEARETAQTPPVKAPDHSPLLLPLVRLLEIREASLIFRDPRQPALPGKVLLSKVNVTGREITPSGVESLTATGLVPGDEKTGSVDISAVVASTPLHSGQWRGETRIRLTDCPVSSLKDLAASVNYAVPFSEGTVNLDLQASGSPDNGKAAGEIGVSNLVLYRGGFFISRVVMDRGGVKFSVARNKDSVFVDISEVDLPGIAGSAEARISDLSQPDPSLAVTLKRAELDLKQVFPFIPLKLLRKEDREKLLQAGLKGRIHITGGAWSGKLSDLPAGLIHKGTIILDALLDKVSGFIPGVGLPVSDATGHIRMSADEMLFKGITVTLGSSPIVVNGWITELKTSPQIDLFLSMSAQAEDLMPLLTNRFVAAHLGQSVSLLQEPTGGVSVSLDVKGDIRSPGLTGSVSLKDFDCRLEGVPLPVKSVNGTLKFQGSGTTFSSIKGLIGESPIELKGEVLPRNTEATIDLKLNPADLRKINVLPAAVEITGSVPVSLKVKGKIPDLSYSVLIDLKSNGLKIGWFAKKKPGIPVSIEASGKREANRLIVEDAYVMMDKTRLHAKASLETDGRTTVAINLPPNGIPTSALVRLADPILELQPGGRVEGDAVIRAEKSNPLQVEANVTLNHISMRLPGFHKPTEGITGAIRWRSNSVHATLDRSRTGTSLVHGTVSVTDFENPRVEVVLESPFLDTTDFTAPPGYVPPLTWGEWIKASPPVRFLARSRGSGYLKIVKGKTALRAFSEFRANLESNRDIIKIPTWQMQFSEGVVRGNGLCDIGAATRAPLTLDFQADQMKMDRIMLYNPEKVNVEGTVTAEGHLEWRLGSGRVNNGINRTGKIEVRVQDGVIHRFDVLSKIFSLVNLGSLLRGRLPDIMGQGLPFQRLTWEMDVFDDKWKVKDLQLTSDAARIHSSGMYFSGQERVDFRVDVSPLVGLDAIFSGLFGNMITRDGKILTTTFRVRGLVDAPDVRLEAFDSPRSQQ